MAKKTRVGVLDDVIDRHHYQMSLHPNFKLHCRDGSRVYFETVDIDGKLKRVTCVVEPAEPTKPKGKTEQERRLSCKEVYNIVEECQTDLAVPPASGKVVYLASEPGTERPGRG